MITSNQIDIAHIQTEVEAVFLAYEAALMSNDLKVLDQLFWHSPLAVRFGTAENLYGMEAIRAFRKARDTGTLKRILRNSRIITYGQDFATTTTEFIREDQSIGRQSQTWARFPEGWRIVSAHISLNGNKSEITSGNNAREA